MALTKYIANDGAVSISDFARHSPLSPSAQVEILADTKNQAESFSRLLSATHEHYLGQGLTPSQAAQKTKSYLRRCAESVSEHYPLSRDKLLMSWLASNFPDGRPPPEPGPWDGPKDPGGGPSGGGGPGDRNPSSPEGGAGGGLASPPAQPNKQRGGLYVFTGSASHHIELAGGPKSAQGAQPVTPAYNVPSQGAKTLRGSGKLFKWAGGVMLDKVANPCSSILKQASRDRIGLSYDASRPDGERFILTVGKSAIPITHLDDEDGRAIAEFASSDKPVIVNLLGTFPGEVKQCRRPHGLLVVTLHPAFLDTKIGWSLTRSDMLLYSLISEVRWETGEPLGLDAAAKQASENLRVIYYKEKTAYQKRATLDVVRQYSFPMDQRNRLNKAVESGRLNLGNTTSNINDVLSTPTFCISQERLVFTGTPRFEFFSLRGEKAELMKLSSEQANKDSSRFSSVDEEAYSGLMRTFNVGAMFRYVNSNNPSAWKSFIQRISALPRGNIETPRVVCPGCTRAVVEDWIAECVDSGAMSDSSVP